MLLLRFRRGDVSRVESLCAQAGAELFEALESDECCLYVANLRGADEEVLVRPAVDAVAPAVVIARLDLLLDLPGASAGVPAPFHYIVETDVLPEHEADFNRWYDREHLPGLAAVPGTIRARRFRNPEASPRYHACYDIATPTTVGNREWLAVRETPWSGKVRPAFRNTKRTLFRRRSW